VGWWIGIFKEIGCSLQQLHLCFLGHESEQIHVFPITGADGHDWRALWGTIAEDVRDL
jgi:hypothetical protein